MKLNLIAPINDLGYGYTGLHVVDELIKLGHEVALFPISKPYCHFRHEENIKKALKNADKWDNDAPCVRLWHQDDMSMFVGHGVHIGFPIFELDTFTEREKWHLDSCDTLFVCSNWAKKVIQNQLEHTVSDRLVKVIPLGVDNEIFTPKLSGRKPTIFLNIGKWEVRKGHIELLEAFCNTFSPYDNVELWMMCENPFLDQGERNGWINYYKSSVLGDKIRILPRVESDLQVAEVMQQADCGIFPSHAEGWNLEALEMLACGKQVIATNYSAHTEFLTEANSWLVPTFGVEPAFDKTLWMPDGKWFYGQGNWAKFTVLTQESLIVHMKHIHHLKQNGELEINKAGLQTAQKFSWKNTAQMIVRALSS